MDLDDVDDVVDEETLWSVLGGIGGGEDDTDGGGGCFRKGCGFGGAVLVMIVVLVVGSWLVSYFSYALWSVLFSALFFLGGAVVSLAVGQLTIGPTAARRMQTAGKVVLGFGGACLVSVFVVMVGLPGTTFFDDKEVSPTGGTLGPITVDGRTWIGVEVEQSIAPGRGSYQRWSFVTAELLDENKEYLSSFGGEFWHYAGYDDGAWEESEDEYQATLLIPSSGTYHIRLKTESNVSADELRPIEFTMGERAWWGHPRPLQRAAYAAFFLGALLLLAPRVGSAQRVRQALEAGGTIRYDGVTYAVWGMAQYEYPDWKSEEWTLKPLDSEEEKKPMFVEYEYEELSDWDNWAVSRPIKASAIQCGRAGKEKEESLPEYLARRSQAPEQVSFESRTYSFEDRGRAYRNGKAFAYRNYEGAMGGFLSIEGDDLDALDAVVGKSIDIRELSVVDEDA